MAAAGLGGLACEETGQLDRQLPLDFVSSVVPSSVYFPELLEEWFWVPVSSLLEIFILISYSSSPLAAPFFLSQTPVSLSKCWLGTVPFFGLSLPAGFSHTRTSLSGRSDFVLSEPNVLSWFSSSQTCDLKPLIIFLSLGISDTEPAATSVFLTGFPPSSYLGL